MDKEFADKLQAIMVRSKDDDGTCSSEQLVSFFENDEVNRGIRKVLDSVKKHNRDNGRKGYLNFIKDYLP